MERLVKGYKLSVLRIFRSWHLLCNSMVTIADNTVLQKFSLLRTSLVAQQARDPCCSWPGKCHMQGI